MANLKSSKKRIRQTERRRLRNASKRSAMRTAIKKVRYAIEAGDAERAVAALPTALSRVGKAAKTGLIHKNAAARYSSRLTRQVNALQGGEQAGA